MAPEIYKKSYNKPVDVFAFGCLIYAVLMGRAPFEGSGRQVVSISLNFYLFISAALFSFLVDEVCLDVFVCGCLIYAVLMGVWMCLHLGV